VTTEAVLDRPAAVTPEDCARQGAVLEAFGEIIDAVGDDGDLSPVLEVLTDRACRLMSVNRCAAYLLDEESGLYRGEVLRVGGRFGKDVKRYASGVEADRFTREILATRRPVLISDAQRDPRPIRAAMVELDVRTVVGVPMVLRGSVIGILYLDQKGSTHSFSDKDLEIIGDFANLAAIAVANVRTTANLRNTLGTVAKQNTALRRAAIAENRLAELALSGADLDQLANGVANLTSKPCAIYGADDRRIGAGSPPGCDQAPGLLEPEDRRLPEIAHALAGLRSRTTSVIGPFRSPGFGHRLLISPISISDEERGWIVIKEQRLRFSAFDAQVARRAAMIIALQLSAQRSAAELHEPNREGLVRDLISGCGDEDTLIRRVRFHGIDPDGSHVMCLLSDERGQRSLGPAARAVAGIIDADALTADVPEGLLVILPVGAGVASDSVASACAVTQDMLESLPETGDCVAGVSGVFSGVSAFPRAYREVRQVNRCLQTFRSDGTDRVLASGELGAGSLFLASTSREEADEFVRNTLGPLHDHSDRSMRDLLATLALFLECERNVRETADRLGVHENTIRYRLARIAELSALDVATNVDDQLAGQLATMILRLEGALPAATDRGGCRLRSRA
jgi:sugar diacid utilization regulator/GAF domain-containing protein